MVRNLDDNRNRIAKLKEKIFDTLYPLIEDDYSLLDIPYHGNIGDSLITLGELDFLEELPFNLIYKCNVECQLEDIPKRGVILFNGGGNFGDLWPGSNLLRRSVILERVNQRIIIFPQSVYYNEDTNLALDISAFQEHPDLIICVRDIVSYEFCKKNFTKNKLLLLPDMAFYINLDKRVDINENLSDSNRGKKRKLILFRADKERIFTLDQVLECIPDFHKNDLLDIKDWPTLGRYKSSNFLIYIFTKIKNLSALIFNTFLLSDERHKMTSDNINLELSRQGFDFFESYEFIYTTRLHGMILAILMGKKVVAFDNSYGKIASFYETWLNDFDDCKLVRK